MRSLFAKNSVTYAFAFLILVSSVALVLLAWQALNAYHHERDLSRQLLRVDQVVKNLERQRRDHERAREFMAQASGFVAKAKELGIRSGQINRYDIDFSQPVSVSKMPLLLEQSKSANGRYYVPQSLRISREGMSMTNDIKTQLESAVQQRHRGYNLSFGGNVFVVNHGS